MRDGPTKALLLGIALLVAACGSSTPPSSSLSPSPIPSPSARPILPNGPIDIGGGRHMQINCGGAGGPVVVLDAGLGNTASVWTPLVRLVQQYTTVCSYDRAGLGGSPPRPRPHGAESAIDDLHALLAATRLAGPYVLVGASFGGLDIQIYARRYPADTAGVVLVDSLATGWDPSLEAILTPAQVAQRRAIPNGEDISNEEIRTSEVAAGTGPSFPPVPLAVLRHGLPFPGGPDWPTAKVEALWASLQAGLAMLSPHATLLVAAESGHRIHEQQPDLVSDAIHAIVDPTRWPPVAPAPAPAFGTGATPVLAGAIAGRFVFRGSDGIFEANTDGSGSALLVPDDAKLAGEPSIDASGRLVAYTLRPKPSTAPGPQPEATSEVWVADTTTGKRHRIAADGEFPRISPDGTQVAFAQQGHTYLVQPDGGGLRDLGAGGCAIWSPDSVSLAMCTPDDAVFILRLSDGRRTNLSIGPDLINPTAWSPDGQNLALFSMRDGNGEIYIADAAGRSEQRLTTAPGNQFADLWLPAGLVVSSSLPNADVSDWFLVDPATGVAQVISWLRGIPDPIAWVAIP